MGNDKETLLENRLKILIKILLKFFCEKYF